MQFNHGLLRFTNYFQLKHGWKGWKKLYLGENRMQVQSRLYRLEQLFGNQQRNYLVVEKSLKNNCCYLDWQTGQVITAEEVHDMARKPGFVIIEIVYKKSI